ncbi:MAG: DUF4886 domain-containing protein [Clostridia bacterium]|nr:DUF4886 domain-containing protein [Clostridia bacterium]
MKKLLSLILTVAIIMGAVALCACGNDTSDTTTSPTDVATTAATTEAITDATAGTTEVATTEATTEATTIATSEATTVATTAENVVGPVIENGSISILAVGNSFSDDAMEHLWGILNDMGYTDITLGRLYIGGCSLQTHATYAASQEAKYTFYANTNGQWMTYGTTSMNFGLEYADWDYISMQQESGSSGIASTFEPYLTNLIAHIRSKCPDATLMWHMTWSYKKNCNHSGFEKYNLDQMTMYEAIVDATATAEEHSEISFVIPVGTAIQNIRSSFIGDNMNRSDGYHLDFGIGRYVAAMMWARQITGLSIDGVRWCPFGYNFSVATMDAVREAVNNAYKAPKQVTESKYSAAPDTSNIMPEDYGYDPDDYTELELQITNHAFYNSTSGYEMSTNASNSNQFACTQIFTRDDLPYGTLIIIDGGYQYRPDGWENPDAKTDSNMRPDTVTETLVEVDRSWWGSYNYRAFNIAEVGNPALDDDGQEGLKYAFRIFVPKTPRDDTTALTEASDIIKKIVADAGYDIDAYDVLNIHTTGRVYYQSDSANLNLLIAGSSATSQQFCASGIFVKGDLPIGSLIVVDNGYQYRPEAWLALDQKTSPRPAAVSDTVTEITAKWWSKLKFRAFNIGRTDGKALTDDEVDQITSHFAILIPKV